MKGPIPYARQLVDDDDVRAVADVLRGDWLTQGPAVRDFERALATTCDVPFAVGFSSGTAALHAAAFAAGLGPGDEAVTSAITFAASANCAAYVGATPRFADIDPATWNVSASTVEQAAGPRTKAVIPVHFAGLSAPVRAIRESLGPDVRIIEDAAHALGAHTGEERVGSCAHSDMAMFSFHPAKVVTCGEGGAVTTRDPELYERLLLFRTHGITKDPERMTRHDGPWHQEQHELGFNYRLSDVHAALGRSQLRKLETFVTRRNELAARYREALVGLPELELPPAADGGRHAYHLFAIRHRGGAEARRALFDHLRERGVLAQVHYVPVYRHPWYQREYGYAAGLCPEAERYYAGCLSLPCYPALTEAEQDHVIAAVREAAPRAVAA
jgi:UDP-4-amino-4,6-dideoxy-N-acetyl-beta-L-altrosamine transaminase